jgi:Archaeal actin homologue MreB-like, C-terminal
MSSIVIISQRCADISQGGNMFTESTIHPGSLLARLCRQEPLTDTEGKGPLRQIPFLRWDRASGNKVSTTATLISVDNGNDAFKGAMLHTSTPQLCTRRIVTAYAPAKELGAGDSVTTWRVDGSEPFWIGEDAFVSRAEGLPLGMTHERLPDERYRRFLFACLVELLLEAGYGHTTEQFQGAYDLFLSFGIPNEEVSHGGLKELTRQALVPFLNTTATIHRSNERGQETIWSVSVVELHPYPQTFGSFVPWYYTLDGAPIETEIVNHLTLDIGGGQFHQCEVTLQHQAEGNPKLRMSASLIDEGTIVLARALRERIRAQHPGIRLSDVEAQQALVNRRVLLEGRRIPIESMVSEIVAARSQTLLTHLRHRLQDERSFLMFTGGGSVLLAPALRQLVRAHRRPESVLFVPTDLASVLNAIGGYMLAQVAAQKVLAQASTLPARETR